ncbi:MAG TPA: helix-turn-helix transcriptional regulator [Streptosporangiaceae bacterium]|nr:helix-turn-helix transcriptional regulator [Streptosporangiaceae bacterium]
MPDLRNSAANRALATELRRLREVSGMSGDEVAIALGWSASKVSRIETNRIGIKPADLTRLLDLYVVDDARRGQLTSLSAEPEPRGWWHGYLDSIAPEYAAYIRQEESAAELKCWSPELIHGLLQTEDYATAIMEIYAPAVSHPTPGMIRRRVEVRMRRQEILSAADRQFSFILDEAALLHRYGDNDLMQRQLLHINEVSHRPNVTIRVLAFGGSHPVVSPGSFALLQFAPVHGTPISDIVYVEQLTRNDFIEDEPATYEYRLAFDRIADGALDEEASRQLISRIAAERWAGATT